MQIGLTFSHMYRNYCLVKMDDLRHKNGQNVMNGANSPSAADVTTNFYVFLRFEPLFSSESASEALPHISRSEISSLFAAVEIL